ncbi:MAG: type II toxin-antitoxin system VapC family toxin [Burkholderiales bacterium]|nr:type II toxin-antitoxin system VapC family toxin [Burkholderiales bacterium]
MGREPVIVLDTHVVVWWVSGSGRLSARAKRAIDRGARQRAVAASAITVLEIATAVRRGRLALGVPLDPWLADLYALPELQFVPVSAAIAQLAGGFDDSMPSDPADRIIAATALTLGADIVTADGRLHDCPHVSTLW